MSSISAYEEPGILESNSIDLYSIDVELSLFGKSYHTNRDKDWNETNLGAGIGLALSKEKDDAWQMVISGGSYDDSYNEQATYFLVGPRVTTGDKFGFHGTAGLFVGYLNGSDNKGAAIVPVVSVGYDWLDLCITADPFEKDATYADGRVTSKMVAVFVKMRLFTF